MMNRRAVTAFVVALLAMAAFVPTATGGRPQQELWEGTWQTHHKFGNPTLYLKQSGDEVFGHYRGGGVRGRINGTLKGKKNRRWQGKFKDTKGGTSEGFFNVHLLSDDQNFSGTFCFSGNFFCGDDIKWRGEKN